jgi:hypothetical protein
MGGEGEVRGRGWREGRRESRRLLFGSSPLEPKQVLHFSDMFEV